MYEYMANRVEEFLHNNKHKDFTLEYIKKELKEWSGNYVGRMIMGVREAGIIGKRKTTLPSGTILLYVKKIPPNIQYMLTYLIYSTDKGNFGYFPNAPKSPVGFRKKAKHFHNRKLLPWFERDKDGNIIQRSSRKSENPHKLDMEALKKKLKDMRKSKKEGGQHG